MISIEVDINPADITITTARSSGARWQNVNKGRNEGSIDAPSYWYPNFSISKTAEVSMIIEATGYEDA